MTVHAAALREVRAQIPTSVSVITTVDARGVPWGVTIGSLGTLSLTPPLVQFSLDVSNTSHDVITGSRRFLVHVLGEHQAEVAAWFANGHGFDHHQPTAHGLPTIPGTPVRLLCGPDTLVPGGDHTLVIGAVREAEIGAGRPLLYHRRGYHVLADTSPETSHPLTRRIARTGR